MTEIFSFMYMGRWSVKNDWQSYRVKDQLTWVKKNRTSTDAYYCTRWTLPIWESFEGNNISKWKLAISEELGSTVPHHKDFMIMQIVTRKDWARTKCFISICADLFTSVFNEEIKLTNDITICIEILEELPRGHLPNQHSMWWNWDGPNLLYRKG